MTDLVVRDEASYLATLDGIRALCDQISQVGDAKDLADRARAAQVWAERAGLEQQKVNLAIVAKLWAERRAGELLSEDPAVGSGKGATLSPLGVSKKQSSRWQKLAAVPRAIYEAVVDDAVAAGRISLNEIFRRVDRKNREAEIADEEAELVAGVNEAGGPSWRIVTSDIRTFDPGPVDAIVTDPPYITEDAVDLYAELGRFAVDHLKPGGALVAMTWQPILPDVIAALEPLDLSYRWLVAWVAGGHESTVDHTRHVFDRWKPVLVYHRATPAPNLRMLTDVVSSGRDAQKGEHPWQQSLGGFRQLIRSVTRPGDIVCDPFAGAGTTCLAALSENCHFVGCDVDPEAVDKAHSRMAA